MPKKQKTKVSPKHPLQPTFAKVDHEKIIAGLALGEALVEHYAALSKDSDTQKIIDLATLKGLLTGMMADSVVEYVNAYGKDALDDFQNKFESRYKPTGANSE